MADERERLVFELGTDPVLAHATLFADRHPDPTPPFHKEIIRDWHSATPNVLTMAFRGAAKSTLSEEAICIEAAFQRTKNCLILGENETRASERLKSIKNAFEQNDGLQFIGDVGPGPIWTDTRAELSNGVMIQAYGRNQSLRGVKHLDFRPDLVFMDDLEDKESVATPEARRKVRSWFTSTVIPALAPRARMRMAATPLHPEALAPTLAKATSSWLSRTYPIIFKTLSGDWSAMWPERFSVAWALKQKADMEELGQGEDFVQEYLCQAEDATAKTFTEEMLRIVPRRPSWHAVYAMYDPARTTNKKSATTGQVVFSWIGPKLVVWDAYARKMMPDEIVRDMFDVDLRYNPVAIGVEETGLNEWLLQPVRTEQAARGHVIPLRPVHAPKGKLDFIRGLQPYFRAGDVEFATDLPDLRKQLLGFPTGDIDAPNALAYALKLKLGLPIYDNFREEHIVEEIRQSRSHCWLAANTDGKITAAALVQVVEGRFSILADWLCEADAGVALREIVTEARIEASASQGSSGKTGSAVSSPAKLRLVSPRLHFADFNNLGLRQAAHKLRADMTRGGDPLHGREELRALMRRVSQGQPAFRVARRARWTLRALAGGFARDVQAEEPQANAYRVLMEGVEAFAAMLRGAALNDDTDRAYAYTESGARYLTARR